MNDIDTIVYHTPHRIRQKWSHDFAVYDRLFAKFRGRRGFRMLEIGISQGGSLRGARTFIEYAKRLMRPGGLGARLC